MSKFNIKSIAPAVISLGLAGGLLGASIGTASAATKPKPKPKTAVTKTTKPAAKAATKSVKVAGTLAAVDAKTDTLTVKVGKASDIFTTTSKTAVTFAGKKVALAGLKAGEHVVVVYNAAGKALDASSVTASKA
jgi:NH3-dependent NAD+ synthetase